MGDARDRGPGSAAMSTTDRRTNAPPLVHGQRLNRAEFHARYEAMPPETRAELIGGVVYIMSSPLGYPHGDTHATVMLWLGHVPYPHPRRRRSPTMRRRPWTTWPSPSPTP